MSVADQPLVVRTHVARDLLQNAALFKTDKLAIWEYVSNGLQYVDKGVSANVHVRIDTKARRITVTDNGRGMDWSGLQNFFVMHGENLDLKQGHRGRGRFGTGKAAAFGIGRRLTISTVRAGRQSRVTLSRDDIQKMSSGDPIPLEVLEREVPVDAPNGTTISIDGIQVRVDQSGVIRYIERHLARWPKDAIVVVNNHQCEFEEPAIARTVTVVPDDDRRKLLGSVSLTLKVSKTPLDETLRGVAIFSNGVWHETTLAGHEGREMSNYIFGEIDVPALDDDESLNPPFDLSRSMRLNAENEIVQAVYAFVGFHVDIVRRELLEQERERKASELAKKLQKEADEIARIINEDFREFQHRLAKVRASAPDGSDFGAAGRGGSDSDDLQVGGSLPALTTDVLGAPGHGNGGDARGTQIPQSAPQVRPSDPPEADTSRRPSGGQGKQPRHRGGFDVKFDAMGGESARAQYVANERTIYVNIDHPQLVAAKGPGTTDDPTFRRLSYEIAFSEYAIALASEFAARDEYLDPSDPIVEIRATLNRLARRGAALYA